jgi:hypothetical protein
MQPIALSRDQSKVLLTALLFYFVLSVFGMAASWNGHTSNALWSVASNWSGGIPGVAGDAVWNISGTSPCYLNYNTGTIRTLQMAHYGDNTRLIILDGGSVNVSNWAGIVNRSGRIDVNAGGRLSVQGNFFVGQYDDSADDEMTLNIYGGIVEVGGTLWFGAYFSGSGVRPHVQLDGGYLYANSISGLQPDRGTLDITEGQLILNGNHISSVKGWIEAGYLTAYKGDGIILSDYNQTNAGKTTITAMEPVDGDTDGDYDVDMTDLMGLADQWLDTTCGLSADFYRDCRINMLDFSKLATNWLYGVSFLAFNPSPEDGQIKSPTTLSWDALYQIHLFDVYIGTNYENVLKANRSSPEYQTTQSDKSFALGSLIPDQIYYWRIDAILGETIHKGAVWSFSTTNTANLAGYIGATCGWQYSAQLEGPVTYPSQTNISLYNPQKGNAAATWEDWAAQIHQAGLDFVCPNLTGSWPNTSCSPRDMAPLVTALKNLGNVTKFAIFDDNAASWCAQWNMANGRGYWYEQPFDISDPANWVFLYEYNYKLFYETVPDSQRFKINGRPVIWIWTGNPYFVANAQGNLSRAMLYVRQRCMEDYGFDPYIVGNRDFISTDSTCANPGVLDATHSWFGPPNDPRTLSIFNGVKTGVSVAQFQNLSNPSGFLDPNHGQLLEDGFHETVGAGALMTLLEGFTDYEEDAAFYRVRNLDANGNPLSYEQTYYDYPNQRLNIIRKHSRRPFPGELKLEVEGCDTFGGAAGGGTPRLYRNGNIAIEPTQDEGGGFNIAYIQPNEWFEWQDIPMEGCGVLQVRVSTISDNCRIHFVIDGQIQSTVTLPNTGGWQTWITAETPVQVYDAGSYHTVRLVCETSGMNINWIRFVAGGPGNTPPFAGLSSPTNNTAYSEPASITFVASAFDSDGSIMKVDFYQGSTVVGTDTTAPYSCTWTNAPAGNYRLTAKATDNNGAITTSLPVFIQVNPLSLNRPAFASSVVNNNVASRAVDADMNTRWESAYSNPQWIYVDLGAVYNISKVVLKWEAAYASSYQIQVSNNAANWTTIYMVTSGNGGYDTLNLSGAGRYVRMYGTTRGTIYGYSLYDFKVYGAF